ncbi:MAG TPA: metallophosphoesterase [Polyangiaceae bacterium]|nr:metallophosphoesterase [Polyangiaceae bacterium]
MDVETNTQQGTRGWLALLAVCALATPACLRAAEERAERDREVGHARAEGLSVDVKQGHAAVLGLETERVTLWGSVPAFELSIGNSTNAARSVELLVYNAMPAAELRQTSGANGTPSAAEWIAPTRVRWRIQVPAGRTLGFALGPADHEQREPFEFALLSDVQEAIDGFHEMVDRVNRETEARFVLGAGDLISEGTRAELERFQAELSRMDIPYYATLGNHELGEEPPPYHDLFGRGNYSFLFHGVRFTLLDSASATLDPLVYDWLADWLGDGRGQTHVVAMHIPPFDPSGTRHGAFANKNEAAKLLNQLALHDVDLTLYGHIHTYIQFENAGIEAHIAGGGGAIPNRGDGVGRHYLVVRLGTAGVVGTRLVQVDSDWDF